MDLRIYFEGDFKLRRGFKSFFQKIAPSEANIIPISCGQKPVDRFLDSIGAYPADFNLVLLDADNILGKLKYNRENLTSLLCSKTKWKSKLDKIPKNRLHFMVIEMESWFLTDREALEKVFGDSFRQSALPDTQDVERLSKNSVWEYLKKATNNKYHKTRYAPELLTAIDPEKIACRASHCRIIIGTLTQNFNSIVS